MKHEPDRIVVQLRSASIRDGVDAELVRHHVECVLRRAYPRSRTVVSISDGLIDHRVLVVGHDAAHQRQIARKLVDFVLARAVRIAARAPARVPAVG